LIIRKKRVSILTIINITILISLALLCVLPFANMLAMSFSSKEAIDEGIITFFPLGLNVDAYKYILSKDAFWQSLKISLIRVAFGVPLNVIIAIITAYPLAKESKKFKTRTIYVWILFFTLLFSGGIIPWYFLLHKLNMLNNMSALILPGAVPVFSIIILINFFRRIPKELEEAAIMDGANHWQILFKIYVPLSVASIATITLFSLVWHWNSWFDGMLLMHDPSKYPLQTYLQQILIETDTSLNQYKGNPEFSFLGNKSARAAGVIISIIPIVIAFPFVQRHFKKGLVLGSVKE